MISFVGAGPGAPDLLTLRGADRLARAQLGHRFAPEEAVSPVEALKTYTTNAAYADNEEGRKGSIEPGKLADLIVCDADPTTLPADDLKDVRPVATILGGRVASGAL